MSEAAHLFDGLINYRLVDPALSRLLPSLLRLVLPLRFGSFRQLLFQKQAIFRRQAVDSFEYFVYYRQ